MEEGPNAFGGWGALGAGFYDSLSFGYFTHLIGGEEATQAAAEHGTYWVGTGVGIAAQVATGYGAAKVLAGAGVTGVGSALQVARTGSLVQRAAVGIAAYDAVGAAAAFTQSSYNLATGQFHPLDTLGFAPALGFGLGSLRSLRGLRTATKSVPDGLVSLDDLTQTARQLNARNASAATAASQINPRLTQRLEAFRAYKANQGPMDLRRWVKATQGNPAYGTGFRSGFADWSRRIGRPLHGNSFAAAGPHDVYVLRNAATGELLHFGETGKGYLTRFAAHQREYAKLGIDIDVDRLSTVEGKAAARAIESRYISTYIRVFDQRPRFNPVNH